MSINFPEVSSIGASGGMVKTDLTRTDQLSSFTDSFSLPVYTGFSMFMRSMSFGVLIRTDGPVSDEILVVAVRLESEQFVLNIYRSGSCGAGNEEAVNSEKLN